MGVLKTDHDYYDSEISTLNQCYLDDYLTDFEEHPEMEYFNKTAFNEDLLAQCKGKTECVAQMN